MPTQSKKIQKNKENLASNEELAKKFVTEAKVDYEAYKSAREQFDDICEVNDYMYKAAQNRSIFSTEKEKGANLPDDERANVGSTMFYRIVNQGASQGVAVQLSRDIPFSYAPIINESLGDSAGKSDEMANQLNMLAKWTMKKDKFNQKSVEFWHQIRKLSNVPVMIEQKTKRAVRKVKIPKVEIVVDENGNAIGDRVVGYSIEEREYIVDNYPSIKVLQNSMLYIDPYIGDMQDQSCVVLARLVNKADIWDLVKTGEFDEQQFKKIKKDHEWDGTTAAEMKEQQLKNNDMTMEAVSSGQFIRWDVWKRVPIEETSWNEDGIPVIYHAIVIGNSIDAGITGKLMRNEDPDDEIPLEMIHENPDDSDLAYHITSGQIIRSNYSVECTLKGLAIDNMALVNNPPMKYLEGMHHVRDFRFKKGALWPVMDMNAIEEMTIRDVTQTTAGLLDYIQQDSMRALSADKTFMGEEFGGRTSATEAGNIYKNSLQPNLVKVRYILDQYLGWYARKIKSYWTAFAKEDQVVRITSENQYFSLKPNEMYGDFDIQIDIVDEFEGDIIRENKIYQALQLVGQSPIFQQSKTHTTDIGELMREWFSKAKFNSAKIIKSPMGVDSSRIAKLENIAMMNGNMDEPQEGEDHQAHLVEHKAERMRYNGVEDQFPNVQILDRHITATEAMLSASSGAVGSLPGMNLAPQTAGEVAGNEIEAAMGAMQ